MQSPSGEVVPTLTSWPAASARSDLKVMPTIPSRPGASAKFDPEVTAVSVISNLNLMGSDPDFAPNWEAAKL